MVLAAPPLGTSGVLRLRKAYVDHLVADGHLLGPDVERLSVSVGQDVHGKRALYLRVVLGPGFPSGQEERAGRLATLQTAARAHAEARGVTFPVLVDFAGHRPRKSSP